MVSLFQSVLHEHLETSLDNELEPPGPDEAPPAGHVAVADTSIRSCPAEHVQGRRRFGRFEKSDPRWIYSAFAMAWRKFHGRHVFNPRPAPPLEIADNTRLILVGDWGTGIPRARKVAELIGSCLERGRRRGLQQHVVHLGDVYYSGLKVEYEKRFLPYWPVVASDAGTIGSWSLCGNHDMYSGGEGYYESLLEDQRFARQEHASFFSLESPHWQILGLDTAWEDHGLKEPQPEWVQSKADESDRKVLLLSHHPLFSAYEEVGPSLERALEKPLASGRVKAWYWGHEHRCMLFKPHQGVEFGRCVGHGGVPVYMSHRPDDPCPEPGLYEYREYIAAERERWALFGFAVLDLDGPTISVRYIDEFGRVFMTEQVA
jgi:Calcineurin-like phosphoesterase